MDKSEKKLNNETKQIIDKNNKDSNQSVSYLENFEKRMDDLEVIGRKRGKRNKLRSIIGILLSLLACGAVLYFGYKFLPEVNNLVDEVDRISKESQGDNSSLVSTTTRIGLEVDKPLMRRKWKRCEVDSDCIETQVGCCDCMVGGIQDAVNHNYFAVWNDEIEARCEMTCNENDNCEPGMSKCIDLMCEYVASDCIQEGGELMLGSSLSNSIKDCCEGLEKINSTSSDLFFCTNCGDNICMSPENLDNCPYDCSLKNIIKNTWQTYEDKRFGIIFKYPEHWITDKHNISPKEIEYFDNGMNNATISFEIFAEDPDIYLNDDEVTRNVYKEKIDEYIRLATDTDMLVNGRTYEIYDLIDYGMYSDEKTGNIVIMITKFIHEEKELFLGFEWKEFPHGEKFDNNKEDFINIISTLQINEENVGFDSDESSDKKDIDSDIVDDVNKSE